MTCIDIRMIEARARAHGIAIERLLRTAGVHRETWYARRRGALGAARGGTIERLHAALEALIAGADAHKPAPILAVLRMIEREVVAAIGGDRELLHALSPWRDRLADMPPAPPALPARRLRLIAIYIAAVEFEIGNADLARALGVERQAVKQARDKVEALRDEPCVDAFLDQLGQTITGRGS